MSHLFVSLLDGDDDFCFCLCSVWSAWWWPMAHGTGGLSLNSTLSSTTSSGFTTYNLDLSLEKDTFVAILLKNF